MLRSLDFMIRFRPLVCVRSSLLAALAFSAATSDAALTPAEIAAALESAEPGNPPIVWQAPAGEWTLSAPADTGDGVDGIRSPQLPHGASQSLLGSVRGPGVLRGWVRSSTELHHDGLTVSVEGGGSRFFSGTGTEEFDLAVPMGTRAVTITFSTDGTISEGSGSVWLDAVRVTRPVISAEEGVDLAGTPGAALATLSAPGGTLEGVPSAESGAQGADAVFLNAATLPELAVDAAGPRLFSFRTRAEPHGAEPWQKAQVRVIPEGETQVLSREDAAAGWQEWSVLGSSFRLQLQPPTSGPLPDSGVLVDALTVTDAAPVTAAAALDTSLTPELSWSTIYFGTPASQPWRGYALPSLSHDGGDVLISQPILPGPFSGGDGLRLIRFPVNGPGLLSFWWKAGGPTGTGETTTVSGDFGGQQPMRQWSQVSQRVNAGVTSLALYWRAGAAPLFLDGLVWQPAVVNPPPAPAAAADLTGNAVLTTAGGWQPVSWAGVGCTDDDALLWSPAAGTAEPLAVNVTGPGWLTFCWQGGDLYCTLDGTAFGLGQSGEHAQWIPAGAHTVTWKGAELPPAMLTLDSIALNATAPAWLAAVEGTGISGLTRDRSRWTPVTDVTHDGTDALQASPAGAAALAASFTGPGTLRFWWKCGDPQPLAEGANRLVFSAPLAGSRTLSGDTDWQEVVIDFTGSERKDVRWEFLRSSRPALPEDGAWVDEISFTPSAPVTLAEAMDAPGQTWTSSGTWLPMGQGGYSTAAGGDVAILQGSGWIETTVQGPGLLKIGLPFGGTYRLWVDGAEAPALSTLPAWPWHRITGAGPHTIRIGEAFSGLIADDFQFVSGPQVTLAEALDVGAGIGASAVGNVQGLASPAAAHDGTDALRLGALPDGASSLTVAGLTGPTRVRYWCRAEGSAAGVFGYPRVPSGGISAQDELAGPFAWREHTLDVLAPQGLTFSARDAAADYTVWLDELRIEPYASVSLAEALHLTAGAVTTSGGAWQAWRPAGVPAGAADGAVVILSMDDTPQSAWLEASVTGPGWFHQSPTAHSWFNTTTTLRRADGSGPTTTLTSAAPVLLMPGEHLIRWTVSPRFQWGGGPALQALVLEKASVEPAGPAPAAVNSGSVTLTAPAAAEGFWYAAAANERDSIRFTDASLARVQGTARLETTLTGPGVLKFEAESPPLIQFPPEWGLTVHLLPAGPDPVPLPAPVYSLKEWNFYSNAPRDHAVERTVVVPPGAWRTVFTGSGAATLNNVRFIPQLSAAAAAAALDLAGNVSVSVNPAAGAAVPAVLNHDGVDALDIHSTHGTDGPVISFTFTGPGLFTGWLRGSLWPTRPADTRVVRWYLDGVLVDAPWEEPLLSGWRPFRLPVTSAGSHTVAFGFGAISNSPVPGHELQLDEISLQPLTSAPLQTALDAAAPVWTAPAGSWAGWASPLASPDETDAAWLLLPPAASEGLPGPALEAAVNGPGALLLDTFGQALRVSVGGEVTELPAAPDGSYWSGLARGVWMSHRITVPPGPQQLRIHGLTSSLAVRPAGVDNLRFEQGAIIPLAEALDLPGAVLGAGAGQPQRWQGESVPAFSHDGADSAVLRSPQAGPVVLTATVNGPAVLSWWQMHHFSAAQLSVSLNGGPLRESGPGLSNLFGVLAVPPVSTTTSPTPYLWQRQEVSLPAGVHTLTWTTEISPGVLPAGTILAALDQLMILPAGGTSLAEALDQPGWNVSTPYPDQVRPVNSAATSVNGSDAVLLAGRTRLSSSGETDATRLTVAVPAPGLLHYRWRRLGGSIGSPTVSSPRAAWMGFDLPVRNLPPLPPLEWQDQIEADPDFGSGWIVLPKAADVNVSMRGIGHGCWLDALSLEPLLPPAQATGAPALAWTFSPEDWIGIPARNIGSVVPTLLPARASTVPVPGRTAWAEATVTGPGRLKFNWGNSGQFLYDGQVLDSPPDEDDYTLIVPAGLHRLRWESPVATEYSQPLFLQEVSWVPSPGVDPIADALDAPQLPWLIPGDINGLERQTTVTLDGSDALRMTAQTAQTFYTVLPGPGSCSWSVRGTGQLAYAAGGPARDGIWTPKSAVWYKQPGPRAVPEPRRVAVGYGPISFTGAPGELIIDQFQFVPDTLTLAEAMDVPGQVWTTSTTPACLPFRGILASDGTDAVTAWGPAAWLETQVTGPAEVSFQALGAQVVLSLNGAAIWRGRPDQPFSELPPPWTTGRIALPAGVHTLRWSLAAAGAFGVDAFQVTPITGGGLIADALDLSGAWAVEAEWTPEAAAAHDGVDAAGFPDADASTPVLRRFVQGPGKMEFWQRGAGALPAVVMTSDAEPQSAWTGAAGPAWARVTAEGIPPGPQMLSWFLEQEGTTIPALDQMVWTPYAPVPLAEALEAGPLTVLSSALLPWGGYQTGSAAANGGDCAISAGGISLLQIRAPGPGRASLRIRCPGNPGARFTLGTENLGAPREWKRVDFVFGDQLTTDIAGVSSASFWVDDLQFTNAADLRAAWLTGHGLAGSPLNADPDGDGRPLLLDYAFGFAPGSPAPDAALPAEAGLPVVDRNPAWPYGLRCRFLRRKAETGLTYRVHFTSDLGPVSGPGSALSQTLPVDADWELVTFTDGPSESGTRFCRVAVTASP